MDSITRIAFVDDHPTLLRGLAAVFDSEAAFSVVATGAAATDIERIVETAQPDIIIVDLSMPGDVFDAISKCVARRPTVKFIVFSAYANVDFVLRAFDTGVSGYVVKGSSPEELFDAIAAANRGELFVSRELGGMVGAELRNRRRARGGARGIQLTPREAQLAQALTEGKTNREIATRLNLTEKTVKHYMTNLMSKLQVKTRLEAALAAQRMLQAGDLGSPIASLGQAPNAEE